MKDSTIRFRESLAELSDTELAGVIVVLGALVQSPAEAIEVGEERGMRLSEVENASDKMDIALEAWLVRGLPSNRESILEISGAVA